MKPKIINTLMIFIAVTLFKQCKNENDFQTKFQELNGNSFIMQVNRQAENINVQFPSQEIDESAYVPTDLIIQHNVSFSNDGQVVTIITNDLPISGQLQKKESNLMTYLLTEGLFADGRLKVWLVNDHFEFEYTVYGSGVPILWSVRGSLIPS